MLCWGPLPHACTVLVLAPERKKREILQTPEFFEQVQDAVICVIVCDRGDRYLSTGVYGDEALAQDPQPCPLQEWPSAEARLELAYPAPHYVVFTADVVDGLPWCPDCARALPIIRDLVSVLPIALHHCLAGLTVRDYA